MRPIPYRPIIAVPFTQNAAYTELAPPPVLRPYIRCFWGTTEPVHPSDAVGLVIPDTCMDIIFEVDETQGSVIDSFCAIDERAYHPGGKPIARPSSTFAIRFYAWTAALFAERPLSGSKNQSFAARAFFPSLLKELTPILLRGASLNERAAAASVILTRRLDSLRVDPCLMNAVDGIVSARGTRKIDDLAALGGISRKRLERVFNEQMGISPKAFSALVRYQLLWQDLCFGTEPSVLDLVEKYGYFDQAHLLNDFKRHHTMTPAQALRYARG